MRDLRRLLALFGFTVALVAAIIFSALFAGPDRSNYAFVDSRGTHTSFVGVTEHPIFFVIGVPVLCALLGWLTGSVLRKRGWELT